MKRKCVIRIGPKGADEVGSVNVSVLINVKQLARRYGISVRTAHNWKKEGRLGYYKLGRAIRFHPTESDQEIRAFRVPARISSL
jgi:excisionase family DNA binding protein